MERERVARLVGSSLNRVVSAGSVLSGVFIILMMVLMVTEVILRYLFRTSTLIADEFSAYFLVVVTFLGLAYTLKVGGHIRIEVVADRLPTNTRRWLALVCSVVGLVFCSVLTWQAWRVAFQSFKVGTLSITIMHTPMFIPLLVVPAGMGLLLLQLIIQAVNRSRDILGRQQRNS